MADRTEDRADQSERNSLDLDALAVSDRFRLFNFTRRDDHVAYLWVLRALDRLRAVHQAQAHSDDVAAALAELAAVHEEAPRLDGSLREKLDALADDGMVHRLEDASRAGSLARYRNRQSVYQFSELGYRAFAAVEDVLSARIRDANLSRLVFSDILDDLKSLVAAVRDGDGEQVYRRLSRLAAVLGDTAPPARPLSTPAGPGSGPPAQNWKTRELREARTAQARKPCSGTPLRPTSVRSWATTSCWRTGAGDGRPCARGLLPTGLAKPAPLACELPPAPRSPESSPCCGRSPRRSGAG